MPQQDLELIGRGRLLVQRMGSSHLEVVLLRRLLLLSAPKRISLARTKLLHLLQRRKKLPRPRLPPLQALGVKVESQAAT